MHTTFDKNRWVRCCCALLFIQTSAFSQDTLWQRLDVGMGQQPIRSLAINVRGDLFVASWQQVFRSTDKGSSWVDISPRFTRIPSINTILPYNDSILFLGTSVSGLFKSTNSGATWRKISDLPYSDVIRSITKGASGMIYLSTGSDDHYSADTGRTWQTLWRLMQGVYGVRSFSANDSGYVLACCGADAQVDPPVLLFSEKTHHVEEMHLAGDTELDLIHSIGLGFYLKGRQNNLYRTSDNGKTWVPMASAPLDIVGVVELSGEEFFALTEYDGLYVTFDTGESWDQLGTDFTIPSPACIALHPDGSLYVGTDHGLLRTKMSLGSIK